MAEIDQTEKAPDPRPQELSHLSVIKSDRQDDTLMTTTEILASLVQKKAEVAVEGMYSTQPLVQPPQAPEVLKFVAAHNNMLKQAIEAMRVNIEETGWNISLANGQKPKKKQEKEMRAITAFFNEPWPQKSITSIRRELRTDLEDLGYAFMEVIRDTSGGISLLNHLSAITMRLVELDEAVPYNVKIRSGEHAKTVTIFGQQRRYAKIDPTTGRPVVYFKEFNASRELDKFTGKWLGPADTKTTQPVVLPANKATEIIMFELAKDGTSPYPSPRWLNQTPSVVGSRKAEELNLEFFNSGGVPPVLLILQGGQLTPQSRASLTDYLSGKAKHKQRAVIAELYATSGDLNSTASTKVSVERFGAENQKDSLFENYDERCSERVRQAFRLPPLFVGRTSDYNRATSYVSYIIAEAQVFKPEREKFDEIINRTLMKEIGPDYVFVSNPVAVQDVAEQLKALQLVRQDVDIADLVREVNKIANLNLPIPDRTGPAKPDPTSELQNPLGENDDKDPDPNFDDDGGDGPDPKGK